MYVERFESRLMLAAQSSSLLLPPDNATSVYGYAFNDRNADGVHDTTANDNVLAGATAYVDLNNNGQLDTGEPSAVSQDTGLFVISWSSSNADGTYTVRVNFPSGYTADTDGAQYQLSSSARTYLGYIGGWQPGTITASAFMDGNADGINNNNDQPLIPTIYADLNNNGQLDSGEPNAQPTISNSLLAKISMKPGTYTFRAVFPSGYTQTSGENGLTGTVTGGMITINPMAFGAYTLTKFSGHVYSDLDHSGSNSNGDLPLAGRTVYGDANNNDQLDPGEVSTVSGTDGAYTLLLPPGPSTVQQVIPQYWAATNGSDGFGHVITVNPNYVYTGSFDLGEVPTTGSISGFVYNDFNGNGTRDTNEVGLSPRSANLLKVWIDTNGNNQIDTGEFSANVDDRGNFRLDNVPAGTYLVKLNTAGTANSPLKQTSPANNGYLTVVVTAGATTSSQIFGVQAQDYVNGQVIRDTNGNGLIDVGESGVAGDVVYVDANNNGQLDTGETTATTGAYGLWNMTLPAGIPVVIRQKLLTGDVQSSPANNAGLNVTPPSAAPSLSVGSFYRYSPNATGNATGFLFNDTNFNGVQDSGESVFTGYGVSAYLDNNNNGILDVGEPSYYTGGSGDYGFKYLAPGTYKLRLVGLELSKLAGTNFPNGQTFQIVAGQTTTLQPMGIQSLNRVQVFAFNDTNGDGKYSAATYETSQPSVTVFADVNDNGVLDTGEPAVFGSGDMYLPAGTYRLRQVLPADYRATGQYADITVSGSTFASDNRVRVPADLISPALPTFYFGSRRKADVDAYAYNDANGNGKQDTGETSTFDGGFVYADLNNNGTFDSGDVKLDSISTDVTYARFMPGTYTFRQSVASGWTATTPANNAGQTVTIGNATDGYVLYFGRKQAATTTSVNLQAEDATMSGGTYKQANHAGYTGSGFADYGGIGSAVQFSVNQATAGAATLSFRYANGSSARPLTIIVNGQTIGTISGANTGSWETWQNFTLNANLIAGNNTIKAIAGAVGGGNLDSLTITSTGNGGNGDNGGGGDTNPPPTGGSSVFIDAGGPAAGNYAADNGFSGGSTYSTTATVDTSAVADPAPQSVYKTERFGNFTYTLSGLTAGSSYTVRLDFAELYWSAAGKRVFSVTGNGASWLNNFDIYAAAGAKNKAIARSFSAVADGNGRIAITFKSSVDNAKISAISVTPSGTTPPPTQTANPVLLDAGGPAAVGTAGSFLADSGYSGGKTASYSTAVNTGGVANPAPQAVYQSERYGDFTYAIANLVAGQQYTLQLDLVENYWNAAGKRSFNVSVNSTPWLSNFDIYSAAGGKNVAIARTVNVAADNAGKITIGFKSLIDNAKVNGIRVIPIG